MSGEIQSIKVRDLVNYDENPRHAVASGEKDTLKKLFEAVGTQYMLNLAEDIQANGLLGNQQIVVVPMQGEHRYIVYEGNRRVAAIKLLLNADEFDFLEKATLDKVKQLSENATIPDELNCYVTDKEEAFFIMERLHSGEDKGRGTKQWTSREKEVFKVRQNHEKKLSYLIDVYVKRYFDGLDITAILPFTTIERIFNNREVKKRIGLDVADESTFTFSRMQLVIDASEWVAQEAKSSGLAVTRLFNKAREIEDKVLPWLDTYMVGKDVDDNSAAEPPTGHDGDQGRKSISPTGSNNGSDAGQDEISKGETDATSSRGTLTGGTRNLPYFFQGLDYSALDPNNSDSHGVSSVCQELKYFSDRRLVSLCPIASAFLVRAIIEQTMIYYSKRHKIQAQEKLIWENIKSMDKLSKIIENYKRNLTNYIDDKQMRNYFTALFDNYEDTVNPLNWVVHKPAEFRLDANALIELPRKGLLALINFMLLQ